MRIMCPTARLAVDTRPLAAARPMVSATRLRQDLACLAVAMILAVGVVVPLPLLDQTPGPAEFVIAFHRQLVDQLASAEPPGAPSTAHLAALLDDGLDLDAIAGRVLGWRWAAAGAADRSAFRLAMQHAIVQAVAAPVGLAVTPGLAVHPGFTPQAHLQLTGLQPDGASVVVFTRVVTQEAVAQPPITQPPVTDPAPERSIAWRLVPSPDGWRLCDLVIDQVSILAGMSWQANIAPQQAGRDVGPTLQPPYRKTAE